MTREEQIDWLTKCRQCKHCYQVKADADEVRCRLKDCRFEPSKEVTEFKRLQQELKGESNEQKTKT